MGVRDRKKIETRKTLLKKAMELFGKYGVADIGMRKLAQESGLALGTYYNYFKGKDDIVFAISDDIFLASFEKACVEPKAQVDKALNKLVLSILERMNKDEEIIFYLVQTISNPDHYIEADSAGRRFTETHIQNYYKLIQQIFPEELKNTDMESFSRLCWHQLMIFIYMWFMDKSKDKTMTKKFIENTHRSLCFGVV